MKINEMIRERRIAKKTYTRTNGRLSWVTAPAGQ